MWLISQMCCGSNERLPEAGAWLTPSSVDEGTLPRAMDTVTTAKLEKRAWIACLLGMGILFVVWLWRRQSAARTREIRDWID